MKKFNDLTTLEKLEYKLAISANPWIIYKLFRAAKIEDKEDEAIKLVDAYNFNKSQLN